MATLAFAGCAERRLVVLIIAALRGLVRPSDLAMRNALVAETMPADRLVGAMGVSRTTADSARIAGVAGRRRTVRRCSAWAPAYVVIAACLCDRLPADARRRRAASVRRGGAGFAFWRDLREGLGLCVGHPVLAGGAVCWRSWST